jgi:hypothetical protein
MSWHFSSFPQEQRVEQQSSLDDILFGVQDKGKKSNQVKV